MTRSAAQLRTTLSSRSSGNMRVARLAIVEMTALPTRSSQPASSTLSPSMTLPSSVWRMVTTG